MKKLTTLGRYRSSIGAEELLEVTTGTQWSDTFVAKVAVMRPNGVHEEVSLDIDSVKELLRQLTLALTEAAR